MDKVYYVYIVFINDVILGVFETQEKADACIEEHLSYYKNFETEEWTVE